MSDSFGKRHFVPPAWAETELRQKCILSNACINFAVQMMSLSYCDLDRIQFSDNWFDADKILSRISSEERIL